MDTLLFLVEVPGPVIFEVAVADQCAEFEDGFGAAFRWFPRCGRLRHRARHHRRDLRGRCCAAAGLGPELHCDAHQGTAADQRRDPGRPDVLMAAEAVAHHGAGDRRHGRLLERLAGHHPGICGGRPVASERATVRLPAHLPRRWRRPRDRRRRSDEPPPRPALVDVRGHHRLVRFRCRAGGGTGQAEQRGGSRRGPPRACRATRRRSRRPHDHHDEAAAAVAGLRPPGTEPGLYTTGRTKGSVDNCPAGEVRNGAGNRTGPVRGQESCRVSHLRQSWQASRQGVLDQ